MITFGGEWLPLPRLRWVRLQKSCRQETKQMGKELIATQHGRVRVSQRAGGRQWPVTSGQEEPPAAGDHVG